MSGVRQVVSAAELKAKWFSSDAIGMVHDHRTEQIVVRMEDGSEFACSFAEHSAHLASS